MTELIEHIKRFVPISEQDIAHIETCFKPLSLAKKEQLLREGQVCKANYFVAKGCLRLFFINEKGIEQTIHFALENWWMSDYTSYSNQKTATFSIQAIEKSLIYALPKSEEESLLAKVPAMEKYFRLMHQKANAVAQYRLKFLYGLSREEMYREFAASFPQFVQRIPQYLLASYLGFTPEYLSQLRAKKIS